MASAYASASATNAPAPASVPAFTNARTPAVPLSPPILSPPPTLRAPPTPPARRTPSQHRSVAAESARPNALLRYRNVPRESGNLRLRPSQHQMNMTNAMEITLYSGFLNTKSVPLVSAALVATYMEHLTLREPLAIIY